MSPVLGGQDNAVLFLRQGRSPYGRCARLPPVSVLRRVPVESEHGGLHSLSPCSLYLTVGSSFVRLSSADEVVVVADGTHSVWCRVAQGRDEALSTRAGKERLSNGKPPLR